jgi:hypothetical protein
MKSLSGVDGFHLAAAFDFEQPALDTAAHDCIMLQCTKTVRAMQHGSMAI